MNDAQAAAGHISVLLAFAANKSFAAGTREVVRLSFRAMPAAAGTYPISFADQPVRREVVDCLASVLTASYVNGIATVNPQPSLRIAVKGQAITLGWPLWASNYVVQESAAAFGPSLTWTNTILSAVTNDVESSSTFPAGEAAKFFRLQKR